MRELKIALLGQWHVHGFDFARKLEHIDGCRVAAAADCPGQWAKELSCPLYPDVEAVFEDSSIDGVIVASSIADHRKVLTQAAQVGKHIFVEKAFAVSDEDAMEISQAVKKSGVHFTISNPVMKAPQMFVKNLMDSGRLGQVYSVHVRQTHDAGYQGTLFSGFYHPLENGGGAMNDMGYKAAHILWNLLGMPREVSCSLQYISPLSQEWKAEESAVAVYSYENGAVAVAESGWMTPKYQCTLDVFGTQGCVTVCDDLITYRIGEDGWRSVSKEELPEPKPYPLNYWIDHIRSGQPDTCYGVDEAMDVTRMIMAAYRAAACPQKL